MASVLDFIKGFGQDREVKAAAIVAVIYALTGEKPVQTKGKDDYGDFIKITPTPKQAEILRANLEAQIAKAPSDVRVDLSDVWTPLVVKKGIPWLLGAGVIGLFTGKKLI
jgi:hypothetical protein